jgi:hypothetical protein
MCEEWRMTDPDPFQDGDEARAPRASRSAWVGFAIVVGAAPWVAIAVEILWP